MVTTYATVLTPPHPNKAFILRTLFLYLYRQKFFVLHFHSKSRPFVLKKCAYEKNSENKHIKKCSKKSTFTKKT